MHALSRFLSTEINTDSIYNSFTDIHGYIYACIYDNSVVSVYMLRNNAEWYTMHACVKAQVLSLARRPNIFRALISSVYI